MHYKNGRPAKIGDPVVGTVFNNGGKIVAATLVSCTPGPDACSALVGYLITVPLTDEEAIKRGYVPVEGPTMKVAVYIKEPVKVQGTEQHGSAGPLAATFYVQDYTECKHLLHAEDAAQAAQPMVGEMAEAETIDYCDAIEQNKQYHVENRGTSGKGDDWEDGFIAAHDTIKNLISTNQVVINEQPPTDNAHVAEGCEKFAEMTEA